MKRGKFGLVAASLMTGLFVLVSCSRSTEVAGVLLTEAGEPVPSANVELMHVITESGQSEGIANLEIVQKIQTDEKGAFKFKDVQAGNYALSIWVVTTGFPEAGYLCITQDDDSPAVIGQEDFSLDCTGLFVIEVESGQDVDLGEIVVKL